MASMKYVLSLQSELSYCVVGYGARKATAAPREPFFGLLAVSNRLFGGTTCVFAFNIIEKHIAIHMLLKT